MGLQTQQMMMSLMLLLDMVNDSYNVMMMML
jgi:hypothetical protein